jgi:hypothetical protein
VWEYYFEPVIVGYPVSRIPVHIRNTIKRRPPNDREFGFFADEHTFVSNNFGKHRGFENKALKIPHQFDDPDDPLRQRASEIIRKYIRPRPEIIEKVDQFYTKYFKGRFVIGVHLRGTDALVHPSRVRVGNYLDFERYFSRLDQLSKLESNATIFVATDAQSTVIKMREQFGDRVVTTDALRHQGGELAGKGPTGEIMPAHLTADPDLAARGGEDAVVDYLLLSRCNHLVHNGASLARTVMLKMPELAVSTTLPKPSYLTRVAYYGSRRLRWARRTVKRIGSR